LCSVRSIIYRVRHGLVFSEASSSGGIHYISQPTGKNDNARRRATLRPSPPDNTAFPMPTVRSSRSPSTVRSFNTSEPLGNISLSPSLPLAFTDR